MWTFGKLERRILWNATRDGGRDNKVVVGPSTVSRASYSRYNYNDTPMRLQSTCYGKTWSEQTKP